MALTRAETLKRYRQRLDTSRRWREKEGYDALWQRLIDLYRGKQFDAMTTEDQIAVNISFSTVNVIYPSISVNNPKIQVWAREPEKDDFAAITQGVLNYWWKHYDVKGQYRLGVKDFLVIGHGWIKTGYKFKEVEEELSPEEYGASFDKAKSEADEYAGANPELAHGLPTDDEIQASLATTKTVVCEDRPFVERVSPFDIFVDPEATSMYDIKWIAQKVTRPLDDVKADKRYRKAARDKATADGGVAAKYLDERQTKERYGNDIKRVTVWEFYDVVRGTMSVFSENGDDFLVDPRKMPYPFGHPFTQIRNYDVPDQFYPLGDLEALECLQLELNKTRSQMMNHRKRYARKHLYRSRTFSQAGLNALESDIDGEMVEVVDENIPLAEAVLPVQQIALPPEFYNHSEMIEADIDKVSGVNEYARGAAPDIRRTATEASIIQDAANSRAVDKLAVIEESVSQVARHLVMLAQTYLTGDQVARVMGKNGQPIWVPYAREDIQGEFDFEVEGGSTMPRNSQSRKQMASELLTAVTPFLQLGVVDPVELLSYILREGFEIQNPERFLMAPPMIDPVTGQPLGDPNVDPNTGQPLGAGPAPAQGAPAPPGGAAPDGAVPNGIINQLKGQVGLNL